MVLKQEATELGEPSEPERLLPPSLVGVLATLWGVFGVLALFSSAISRLSVYVIDAVRHGMNGFQWALLFVWTLLNAYGEGYRVLQKRFAPRVIARALHLGRHPETWHALLAPAFCMALFHARRRRLIVAWSTLLMIIFFISLLRITPQPWRGIVDAGVVVPLAWGWVTILVLFVRATRGVPPTVPSDVPDAA